MTGSAMLDARMRNLLDGPPDQPLIEAGGKWLTVGDVRQISDDMDAALASARVPGDAPIGLVARNRAPHVAVLFGLLARTRTVVMLHAYQATHGLAEELRQLRLVAVLADPQDWTPEIVGAAAESGTLGLTLMPDGVVALPEAATCDLNAHFPARPGVAIEMLTSGTTGRPKRVPMTYAALSDAVGDAGLATTQAGTTDMSAPYIQFYPLGNISGLYGLLTCASAGQRIVLLEKFSVADWVRAVETYRPATFMSLPPAALRMVLDAQVPREALASIPVLRCGSAPLDPDLQQAFEERYGIPILVNYGATEFSGVVANWTIDDHRRFAAAKRGSVGRARPGISLRIADVESGSILPEGQVGRLEVLAPRLSPDWVRTTDLAAIDGDGFLFLKGRADSVIIRGGFKVSPEAVAEALRAHPAIKDAAIVGVPDARLGEVPVAVIEPLGDEAVPNGSELTAFLRERLAAQMVPVRFHAVAGLPRTASMKVDRAAVAALVRDLEPAQ